MSHQEMLLPWQHQRRTDLELEMLEIPIQRQRLQKRRRLNPRIPRRQQPLQPLQPLLLLPSFGPDGATVVILAVGHPPTTDVPLPSH